MMIAPSILAGDFGNLQHEIEMLNDSDASFIHVDVMDGVFVPNISFGFPVIEAIKKHAKKPLDVHLMITDPDQYLERFRDAGAGGITIHYEVCPHLNRTLDAITKLGIRAGVAINPHTSVSLLENIIEYAGLVLVMSVNPGFGAQKFIPNSFQKIRQVAYLREKTSSHALIEVDGGVEDKNAFELMQAGCDILVAGTSIFSHPDPAFAIQNLKLAADYGNRSHAGFLGDDRNTN